MVLFFIYVQNLITFREGPSIAIRISRARLESLTASACKVEGSVSSEPEPDTGSLEKYFQRAIARAAGLAKVLSYKLM